ncbi:hypothetical protein [Methanobrevibacter olleyae]|uniref:Uncharacterized protein n=1 Tax=Methanobrevibacter olleyae TaxID=294671 RepID=A0A126QZ40_METOL|nr:hypothetical protein [Methanobrevibacter olleyae]AMK15057.1 hypothetical protein YLM1_0500 [Methanobrevibacter olleyae]
MKEITTILLILIAVIGIISIIIVKLYYRDKEKDDEKEKLEEFINSTKADYDNEKRRQVRKTTNKNRTNLSQAQEYAKTIDIVENENLGETSALFRQRRKAMENAPKKQVRRVKRVHPEAVNGPKKQVIPKKVKRTPNRIKTQMNKEEEIESFQEPIKPQHTSTIKRAQQKKAQPKARQVPMTEKQKEFIAKDANKLVIEDSDDAVKVVKSIKSSDAIAEVKESSKIEDETVKVDEKDEIVKKAEADTAEIIKKIEEAKEEVEDKLADTTIDKTEEIKEAVKEELSETKVEEAKETPEIEPTIEAKPRVEEAKETPEIEPTIEAKHRVEELETATETKPKVEKTKPTTETEPKVGETEPTIETESRVKEARSTITEGASKVSDKISQVAEKVYNDDLHLILNKDKKVEVDETPENDFVTINSDSESSSQNKELISSAIKSIRNFRKPNVPEEPVIEKIKDDIVPNDYAQDFGDGIEYIGDTITITPIHEEERDLANNQPNEDVDKIYKEINKESYNKTDDDELSESFEDVTDETSEKDANVYTKEDYLKAENKEKEKKHRAENTKKILGSKGISEEELHKRAEAKANSKRTRKASPAKEEPVEEGQKRLTLHKYRTDVEEVYINGTLFELKVGQIIMFDIKGETYSSQILKLKPGYIGVRYRSKKIWVKSNSVKKILK